MSQTAIEALAEAWASIEGKAKHFKDGKTGADTNGHYEGYMAEAREMVERLEKRGLTVSALASLSHTMGVKSREVLFFASYCGEDNSDCSSHRPCQTCLGMSNVYRIPDGTPIEYVRELDPNALSALTPTQQPVGEAEPVAEVVWYDPRSDMLMYERPHKIIDASIEFIENAPLGTKLYAQPQAVPGWEKAAADTLMQAHNFLAQTITEDHEWARGLDRKILDTLAALNAEVSKS